MGKPWIEVEALHDIATQAEAVDLVLGKLVGQAGHPGVHLGAAELLVVRDLAGGHLDQRGTAEEDLGPLPDHHDVVAHAGDIGPTGGGVAKDQRDRRDAGCGQLREVAKHRPAGDEDLGLRREVGTSGLDQKDQW
jgi:hypothetical protein